MNAKTLLENLLAVEDEENRKALLQAHRSLLDTAFFHILKEQVLELARQDTQKALQAAQAGLEAAEFAPEQQGVAYAWWARGNALLFAGQLEDCLLAYSTAISVFAGLGQGEQVAQLQTNCMLPLMYTGHYTEARAMGQSALEALSSQGETRPVANLVLNLGICALRQGDHNGALTHIQRAAEIFAQLGDTVQVARCQVTQSMPLRHLDRFDQAEALLHSALQTLAENGAWVPWARAAANLGILRARLAHHQDALHWLEQSRRAFLEAGIEMDAAVTDLYRVQSFLDVNLLPEAATLAQELVETFTRLEMPRQVARAALLLAQVYTRREKVNLALGELERARQIFDAQGDETEVALLDLRLAALRQAQGQPGEALRLATAAAYVLDARHYPLRHAEAHLVIAAACEDLGKIEEAQVAYRVAWAAGSHPTGTTEPPPVLAYHIAHARGAIAEAAGQQELARGEYNRAVNYLEQITRGLGMDELRGGYLADKRPVYEAALRLALEQARTDEALRYSELARCATFWPANGICLYALNKQTLRSWRRSRRVGPGGLALCTGRWTWQPRPMKRQRNWRIKQPACASWPTWNES